MNVNLRHTRAEVEALAEGQPKESARVQLIHDLARDWLEMRAWLDECRKLRLVWIDGNGEPTPGEMPTLIGGVK